MMSEWIPKEICEMDEFLPEELKPLYKYVKKNRGENIAVALHVFEERVLFSFSMAQELQRILGMDEAPLRDKTDDPKLNWEIIRTYEHEPKSDGERVIDIKKFKTEKRRVKKYFLRGWLEIGLWERGGFREQKIYPAPFEPEDAGLPDNKKDHFFYAEHVRFSIAAMGNYWDKYLKLRPEKRSQRPRFVNRKQSATSGNAWHVFVTSDLREYYYNEGETVRNQHSAEFPPVPGEMMTINCLKESETEHAAIANYDSWQIFLHALNREEGKMTHSENTMLGRIQRLQEEAVRDQIPISEEIRNLLKQVATDTRLSELSQKEQDEMRQASDISPKVRLLLRMAQLRFIRSKTAEYLAGSAQVTEDAGRPLIPRVGHAIMRWISPSWEPRWAGEPATAADIPEQDHLFRIEDGDIRISCYWRGPHRNKPAYIRIAWKANITTPGKLYARFVNPETQEIRSQVCLGSDQRGDEVFTSDELGFDPSGERWAISVLFTETE